jgi:transcriptional regulator with XRE-family HTH domain
MSPRRRGPAVAKRQLGLRLRRARLAAKKTQSEVANALDWSASKILRIENGQVAVATSDLMALLTQYNFTEKESAELIELARTSRQSTVSDSYRDVLTSAFADWLEHEAYAVVIQQYETKLIPGVLQTEDYAYALVRALMGKEADEETVNRIVAARLERAKHLTGPDGPAISFIIDESALRRGVGNEHGPYDYAVMIAQLEKLKRMNTRGRRAQQEAIEPDLNPNIGIQIVPFEIGGYQALRGPFELLEFEEPEDDNMVYFENPDGDIVIYDNKSKTARYLDMFTGMNKALSEYAAVNELIDKIVELMKQRQNGIPAP